jgi:hypothetical protein
MTRAGTSRSPESPEFGARTNWSARRVAGREASSAREGWTRTWQHQSPEFGVRGGPVLPSGTRGGKCLLPKNFSRKGGCPRPAPNPRTLYRGFRGFRGSGGSGAPKSRNHRIRCFRGFRSFRPASSSRRHDVTRSGLAPAGPDARGAPDPGAGRSPRMSLAPAVPLADMPERSGRRAAPGATEPPTGGASAAVAVRARSGPVADDRAVPGPPDAIAELREALGLLPAFEIVEAARRGSARVDRTRRPPVPRPPRPGPRARWRLVVTAEDVRLELRSAAEHDPAALREGKGRVEFLGPGGRRSAGAPS